MINACNQPRQLLKILLCITFTACLALTLGGLWARWAFAPWGDPKPGDISSPKHYYERTMSLREGRDAFQKLQLESSPSEFSARQLLDIVSRTFIHKADGAYHLNAFDNWIMWVRSSFDPRAKISQDGDLLWRRGHGFCDQAAMVFVSLAQQLGFRSRLLWLEGHVVAEVLVPELGGRVVDPDLGIWWNFSSADLAKGVSRDQIVQTIVGAGYDRALAQKLADVYVSTHDNELTKMPYLPKLQRFEVISGWVSLALSFLGVIACGIGLFKRPSPRLI
jgi:hypothetical protein